MTIGYNKLWKQLIDKKLKKQDLCNMTGLSPATMAKLSKGKNINTEVLLRICKALDCDISDIMEIENDAWKKSLITLTQKSWLLYEQRYCQKLTANGTTKNFCFAAYSSDKSPAIIVPQILSAVLSHFKA